jgi:hypothetical protein
MAAFRRRLALGALVLTALQFALLFAAPMSCCVPFRLKAETTQMEHVASAFRRNGAADECPLHKSKDLGSKSEAQNSPCRMTCDAPHGPQFLLGAIGVLSSPDSGAVEMVSSALAAVAAPTTTARPAFPDAPPPRLL